MREPPELAELIQTIRGKVERFNVDRIVQGGHLSFDIVHVATARLLEARAFLTFDANQRKLAGIARMVAGP